MFHNLTLSFLIDFFLHPQFKILTNLNFPPKQKISILKKPLVILTSSSGLQAYDLFGPDICRDLVKIRQGELQSERDQVILFFLNFEQCMIEFFYFIFRSWKIGLIWKKNTRTCVKKTLVLLKISKRKWLNGEFYLFSCLDW